MPAQCTADASDEADWGRLVGTNCAGVIFRVNDWIMSQQSNWLHYRHLRNISYRLFSRCSPRGRGAGKGEGCASNISGSYVARWQPSPYLIPRSASPVSDPLIQQFSATLTVTPWGQKKKKSHNRVTTVITLLGYVHYRWLADSPSRPCQIIGCWTRRRNDRDQQIPQRCRPRRLSRDADAGDVWPSWRRSGCGRLRRLTPRVPQKRRSDWRRRTALPVPIRAPTCAPGIATTNQRFDQG